MMPSRRPPYLSHASIDLIQAWQRIDDATAKVRAATEAYEASKPGNDGETIAAAKIEQLKAILVAIEAIQAYDRLDTDACRCYTISKRKAMQTWIDDFTANLQGGEFKMANCTKQTVLDLAGRHPEYIALKTASQQRPVYGSAAYQLGQQQDMAIAALSKVRKGRGDWWANRLRDEKHRAAYPGVTTETMPTDTKHNEFHFSEIGPSQR